MLTRLISLYLIRETLVVKLLTSFTYHPQRRYLEMIGNLVRHQLNMDFDSIRFLPNLVHVLLTKSRPKNSDVIFIFIILTKLDHFDLLMVSHPRLIKKSSFQNS